MMNWMISVKMCKELEVWSSLYTKKLLNRIKDMYKHVNDGENLLCVAADQLFHFPATFTFVVRTFSVLDGIGKGFDPRFGNFIEIAKIYALELLRFREAGAEVAIKASP
ncbi:hypothetical protein C5167_006673 [Papaver somniferum]|uniref:Uncharacterized protein n=1 Tax=Papaver somniferum TaxID=3469 RepID=A0A4Y7JEX6_PAPSO|nr:hypothetical protein C5167_006673 [Papaver somniferum]